MISCNSGQGEILIRGLTGEQALINAALEQFSIPGDASFPLNQAFEAPRDRQEAETLRQYDPLVSSLI